MSGLFSDGSYLRELERQMQQPHGYRPRGKGIYIFGGMDCTERGNYSEIVDYVIGKIQMGQLKKRIDEIFLPFEKELIFRNKKHKKTFYNLLSGSKAQSMVEQPTFGAAVFLLSADERLWEKTKGNVLDTGVYFERIRLGKAVLEEYILFHAAKDIYFGSNHLQLSELSDRTLVSDEMLRLIVNAFVIEKCGIGIIGQEVKKC